MKILNIAGYKFISLNELEALRDVMLARCHSLALKGTILLSGEGINLSLAGTIADINEFKTHLKDDQRFSDISFHETYSSRQPFRNLKVKLKKEIITLRQSDANPVFCERAPAISPEELKQWLDEKRDITLLDTRNDYEIQFGTFVNAVNLHLENFGELPAALAGIDKTKPVVMFCTGGIRCEKAGLYMLHHGFSNVYQLDGGILGYFKKVGGAHFEGECFVFDERVALGADLMSSPIYATLH